MSDVTREIDFQHKVLMLTINRSIIEADNVYEAVRSAWRLDVQKARKADFALALEKGCVIGVFSPLIWMEVTKENFPSRKEYPGRWGFVGRQAPDEIKKLYLGTRVPDSMRQPGGANPVRYSY